MEQNDAVLGAESGAQSKQATICSSFSGATFIQLWRMPSADEQQEWLVQCTGTFTCYRYNPAIDP